MTAVREATILTHHRAGQTRAALDHIIAAARASGVTLRFDADETRKHGLEQAEGLILDAPLSLDVDLCLALGGDGTLLRGLALYARSDVPLFGVNFGEIGFLATIDPDQLEDGIRRAFARDFDLLQLPAIETDTASGKHLAINDVSVHRKMGQRIAELAFVLDGQQLGRVRCDGLVVATPAGSTGYNLANAGPVMAWGVEGYVVSYIAPHSLTGRSALVVAPDDKLTIENLSDVPVELFVDGREVCELAPKGAMPTRYVRDAAVLAQLPGSSFYERLHQKFGPLAS